MAQTQSPRSFTTQGLVGLLVIAGLVGAAVGYMAGRTFPPAGAVPHTGIVVGSGENGISVEADGWTYGIPLDVAWMDGSNTLHDGGRPDCIPPGVGRIEIRFYSLDAAIAEVGTRPVVFVDCRRTVAQP